MRQAKDKFYQKYVFHLEDTSDLVTDLVTEAMPVTRSEVASKSEVKYRFFINLVFSVPHSFSSIKKRASNVHAVWALTGTRFYEP